MQLVRELENNDIYDRLKHIKILENLNTDGSNQKYRIEELGAVFEKGIDFLDWINENIELGSIFPDYSSRIMTAYQVIVFRTGSDKDQAMALASFLVTQDKFPIMSITMNNAHMIDGNVVFDLKNKCIIKAAPA